MAKAWIENDNIFVTTDETIAPPTAVDVPSGTTPEDLVIDGGTLRLKTQEEKLAELKQEKLQQLKTYVASLLSQTDWVIIKLNSLALEGKSQGEIEQEKAKYQSVLEQRASIRNWNAQTEQAIQNAQTIEELEAIKIEYA